jgi:hypothetical protein
MSITNRACSEICASMVSQGQASKRRRRTGSGVQLNGRSPLEIRERWIGMFAFSFCPIEMLTYYISWMDLRRHQSQRCFLKNYPMEMLELKRSKSPKIARVLLLWVGLFPCTCKFICLNDILLIGGADTVSCIFLFDLQSIYLCFFHRLRRLLNIFSRYGHVPGSPEKGTG